MEYRIREGKKITEEGMISWIEGKSMAILLHVSAFTLSICQVCAGHF